MKDFAYSMSTRVHFGKGHLWELQDILAQYGHKVLLVYGGKSIKHSGLYEEIITLLRAFDVFEISGILPNPRIDRVKEGVRICKENAVEVILAVGGGSVIDTAKAIAAGAYYPGDAWDLITMKAPIEKALPICAVLTISAAGTETGTGMVISNMDTKEKLGADSVHVIPKVSILNPEYTYTVSKLQTAAGSIDIISHILEQYFTDGSTFIADQLCEGVLRAVIKYAPVAMVEPENYEARAQLMWASTMANNGILSLGSDIYAFSVHGIEHELSAKYDITHGVGLAMITPNWMRYILNDKTVDRFAHYAISVWNIDSSMDRYEIARQGIQATEDFFKTLGVSTRLSEVGIDCTYFEEISEQAVKNGYLEYAWIPLTKHEVREILEKSL